MDPYKAALALLGFALLGAAWLPHVLKRHPLTFPIAYVAVGMLLYALPLPLPSADPLRFPKVAEQLTELALLVALVGAGLRIDTRVDAPPWRLTWRLLCISMPLTIGMGCLLGHYLLELPLPAALLLGAILAPTDPVLATDVQVSGPGEGREDNVRFALTSEAGLNDALAFPFVRLAVLAAAASGMNIDWGSWLLRDVLWRTVGAAVLGGALGYGLMYAIFRSERAPTLARSSDGLTALAITLAVYGVAELCHTYGFLAVFVAAVVIRQQEHAHHYHETLNLFAEQCERSLMAVLLLLLGGAVVGGLLVPFSWQHLAFALLFVLLVRPFVGWLGLLGSNTHPLERWTIAVFGIRGIGSFYYLAFAATHAALSDLHALWSVVIWTVLASILLHGLSAELTMTRLDEWRRRSRH